MTYAYKCDICGRFSADFEKNHHRWSLGVEEYNSLGPHSNPMDICNNCFEFLERELAELKLRIKQRTKGQDD